MSWSFATYVVVPDVVGGDPRGVVGMHPGVRGLPSGAESSGPKVRPRGRVGEAARCVHVGVGRRCGRVDKAGDMGVRRRGAPTRPDLPGHARREREQAQWDLCRAIG